ncbi:Tudor domain-containing protein 5 [Dufourea novaeangliae]|uniref:Tudor domain-containing protein 5 n=1 Tax=Dufourea novaeangliae TaxID=178035 RepID=A0A154PQ87_DUFNO|nr:Tudor domain-containing protein 5 [Dufourea novaeangliae]
MNSRTREDVETTILALLVCRRGGCSLTQLCRDYYDLECEQIPWKALGYTTLLSFFQSMSKTVQIENRNNIIFVKGVASNKSKHVSILIDGQKQQKSLVGRKSYRPSHYYPKTGPPRIRISAKILSTIIDLVNMHPDGVNKDFILQRIQMDMPFANITMSDIEDQLHELSHKVYLSNNKIFPVQSKSQISHLKSSKVTAGGEEDSDNMSDYADEDDFQFIPHGDTSHASDAKSFMKTKSTSSFIQETVFKWQDQTTEDKPDKYTREKETNTNNSHNLYNDNCNDNIQIHTNCNSNIENENYLDGTHAEDLISDKVRFRLEKLIQNNPDGIWCADLPEKYLEEYKVSLNYTELGFNSVREFASQLTEIFHCVQLENTGDFVLYSAKSGIPSSNSKEKQKTVNLAELHQIYERDEEAEALPTTLSLDTCKKLIPDGIVTIGESVGQLNVADLVTDEKPYIEVVVVEVFTPSFFWVQLRKKQKSFKTFMDDLHTFYTTKHQDYVIPPVVLEKGLNCACMYNNIWHRGIIKTVKPDLQVTVMFYDYGTLKTYPPDAVYYLHRVFSSIPAQAIPCGLINTRPYKGLKWTRNATHQFAVRTSSTPLIATVASVDIEDNSIMVTLTDTLEEEDVHINDWLVEQKLAEHGKMGDKVDMQNLLLYVEENLLYVPEQCYDEENKVGSARNKNSEETSVNAPLISPQSTLGDKDFKFPSHHESSDELQKLSAIKESDLQYQASKIDTKPDSFTPPKTNTNPFMQDEPICDQSKCEITPEKFMQLWNENLKLQIQITATFQILFKKVMQKSGTKVNDNPIINSATDINSHVKNNSNPATSNMVNTNATNACSVATNDTKNIENNTLDVNSYTDFLQDSIKNLNSIYSTFLTLESNTLNVANQSSPCKQIPMMKNATSEMENVNMKFNSDSQNCFTNSTNASCPVALETPVDLNQPLKETNPFKLSLANKLRIPESQEENCSNLDDSNNSQEHVIEPKQEETHALTHNTMNHCTTTSWLPTNNFVSPVVTVQDNTNIDEGYSTRPSTSHTSYRSSPLVQTTNAADQYSTSTKMWIKSAVDTIPTQPVILDKLYSPSKEYNDLKVTCNQNQFPHKNIENGAVKGIPEPRLSVDYAGVKNSSQDHSRANSLMEKTRDIIYSPGSLQLISLKSTLRTLSKMKILSMQEINDAISYPVATNSIMHEIWVNSIKVYNIL